MQLIPHNFSDKNVCVVGLGYVGLTLAVALAQKGFNVTGVEINPTVLTALQNNKAHFVEHGFDAVLSEQLVTGQLRVATEIPENNCTVYIITVGTPIVNHAVNLSSIQKVSEQISKRLKAGDLVILRSTVKVGATREIVKTILDRAQVPYCLAMCPERTLEGKALQELSHLPQIVAGIDDESLHRAATFFSMLTATVVKVSSLETAELAKLVNNTQRDLNFAFANEVALMAETLKLNVNEIIHAVNHHYPRSHLAKPGVVGGPCLTKDPYIYAESVAHTDFTPQIALAGRHLNETLVKKAVNKINQLSQKESWSQHKNQKIAILGLAFKGVPETDDTRDSLALLLIKEIKQTFPKATIVGFDKLLTQDKVEALGIEYAHSLENALHETHLACIQNNHAAFKQPEFFMASNKMATGGIIYDFWFQLDAKYLAKNVRYCALGLGSEC
jgi:UDP-N-acetyl-D-mannosaminuronic acid dehydrogenase